MSRNQYWSGFTAGLGTAAAAGLLVTTAFQLIGRKRPIVRLQKSLQIGRPLEEVFNAWVNAAALPGMSHIVRELRLKDDRWHWRVVLNGREIEWDAEVEQFIPNQAIGWKSLTGPKHTGRITFSPLEKDTLIQVTMNYAPRRFVPGALVAPLASRLERYLDQVLRDFKSALEGKGQEEAVRRGPRAESTISEYSGSYGSASTGTYGSINTPPIQNTRFGGPTNPIESPRPPEAKS